MLLSSNFKEKRIKNYRFEVSGQRYMHVNSRITTEGQVCLILKFAILTIERLSQFEFIDVLLTIPTFVCILVKALMFKISGVWYDVFLTHFQIQRLIYWLLILDGNINNVLIMFCGESCLHIEKLHFEIKKKQKTQIFLQNKWSSTAQVSVWDFLFFFFMIFLFLFF